MSEILITIASVVAIVDIFMGLIVLYNTIKCIFNHVFLKPKLCSFIFAIVVLSFIVSGLDILIPDIIKKTYSIFHNMLQYFYTSNFCDI